MFLGYLFLYFLRNIRGFFLGITCFLFSSICQSDLSALDMSMSPILFIPPTPRRIIMYNRRSHYAPM
jgi:hypothetical protein